jgi:hypothetical protein
VPFFLIAHGMIFARLHAETLADAGQRPISTSKLGHVH